MYQPRKSVPFNTHDMKVFSLCLLSKSFILGSYRCQKYQRGWASHSASGNNLFTSTCARHPTRQPGPLPAIYPLTNLCLKKHEIHILSSPYQHASNPCQEFLLQFLDGLNINVWSHFLTFMNSLTPFWLISEAVKQKSSFWTFCSI